jgi:hypothetical protein
MDFETNFKHGGPADAGRKTYALDMFLEKTVLHKDSDYDVFNSNKLVPDVEAATAEYDDMTEKIHSSPIFREATPEGKLEMREQRKDFQLTMESQLRRAEMMRTIGTRVLDFYRQHLKKDAISYLDGLEALVPGPTANFWKCPLNRAREFRRYMLREWGGASTAVRQEIEEERDALPAASTRQELLGLLTKADALQHEIKRHSQLNVDDITTGKLAETWKDPQYVFFLRQRMPNNAMEIARVRDYIDEEEAPTMTAVREKIRKVCQTPVSIKHGPRDITANQAAIQDRDMEIANLRAQLNSLYTSNAAYGQPNPGLGYTHTSSQPHPTQWRPRQTPDQQPVYQPASCRYWDGHTCSYMSKDGAPCPMAAFHTPGVNSRPHYLVVKAEEKEEEPKRARYTY